MLLISAVLFIILVAFPPTKGKLAKVDIPQGMNVTLLDFFVNEELALFCQLGVQNASLLQWRFYSYKDAVRRQYLPDNGKYPTVEVSNVNSNSILRISPLVLSDAGRYDCLVGKIMMASWRVSLRTVESMRYILKARGQTPRDPTIIRDKSIGLHWTAWTDCDGCAGNGERKRFGFCYVSWGSETAHCSSREMPVMLRTLARSRTEELVVDVCYDQCTEELSPLFVREQRIQVKNGASVKFSCHQNTSTQSSVRWELNGVTLKRNDVSYGYVASKSVYVSKDNRLFYNNIHMPKGGSIRFACVMNRKRRIVFNLVVAPLITIDVASFLDHLHWMAITSAIQVTVFMVALTFYAAARSFADDISLDV